MLRNNDWATCASTGETTTTRSNDGSVIITIIAMDEEGEHSLWPRSLWFTRIIMLQVSCLSEDVMRTQDLQKCPNKLNDTLVVVV